MSNTSNNNNYISCQINNDKNNNQSIIIITITTKKDPNCPIIFNESIPQHEEIIKNIFYKSNSLPLSCSRDEEFSSSENVSIF